MSQGDFVNRGQALVASGQFQEAVKVCRLGLLGAPSTIDGRVVLARALLGLKRFDEVLAEMRVASELDPAAPAPLVLKAEALLRKGDAQAAIEALTRARALAPNDPKIAALFAEAERGGKPAAAAASAMGYVRETSIEPHRHSAALPAGDRPPPSTRFPGPGEAGEEDTEDAAHYTKPTSVATKSGRQRAVRPKAGSDPFGNTVEVDPDVDAVELDDDDIGALSPPPSVAKPLGGKAAARSGKLPSPRDSGVELDAEDLIVDDEETPPPVDPRGGRSAVRSAVGMMSGPLDSFPVGQPQGSLAQALAGTPHVQVAPLPGVPAAPRVAQPSQQPRPGKPGSLAASQSPTQTLPLPAPSPAAPKPVSPASYAAAAAPTLALSAAQVRSANAVDAMFPAPAPQPLQPPQEPQQIAPSIPWAQSTVVAKGPNGLPGPGQGMQPAPVAALAQGGVDPALAALAASADAGQSGAVLTVGERPQSSADRPMKTGMRRSRSKLRVVLWVVLGTAVIGSGVFAGFQIRAMRLGNQIDSARARANALAKDDTWAGWAAARDGLAGIVQASGTVDNRAALARARASIAFELGDGLGDAKQAVDALKGEGGLDGQLASAYLALASDDPKAAKTAGDAALALAPTDAAALYVAGRAQLLAGDANGATAHLKAAVDAEPRAFYAVGLATALGEANAWDDALAATDRALAPGGDNPAAVIARAELSARSGRVAPGNQLGSQLRGQLDKLVAEGGKPLADQARGVSPEQVALADIALADVQLARGDAPGALAAVKAALALDLDDQRVVEGIIDAFLAQGDDARAKLTAEKTIEHWPNSRAGRIGLAHALIALGKPDDALAAIAKSGEVTTLPLGVAVRGDAKLAAGDSEGAAADFEAALKREPKLEAAILGRVALDLAAGKIDDARRAIEPRFAGKDAVASLAVTIAYAQVLRASGDPAQLDKARVMLDKIAAEPATPDVVRAKLELARIYRDTGDLRRARDLYGEAASAGSIDARLDSGVLMIDDRDPRDGYDALEQLAKSLGDAAPANVLLEAARAAMLVGDHAGALAHLDQAEKARGLVRWQLDRERGRLAFRRGDVAGAAQALLRALDACGADPETFLLAADVVYMDLATADDKTPAKLPELAAKVTALSAERLVGRPEADVIKGMLALANGKTDEATAAYKKASDALDAEKASSRRRARASYGFAILAYNARNLPEAKTQLDIVLGQDPTSYSAYLYRADVLGEQKDKKGALADALQAVAYNPELIDGWYFVGKFAHDLADKKTLELAVGKLAAIAPDSPHLRELQQLK